MTSTADASLPPDPLSVLRQRWLTLLISGVVGGALGVGLSYLVPPTFTARTIILPPQASNSMTGLSGQLGSLSALAGLGGGRSTPDQFVAYLSTDTVTDRIIDRFDLVKAFEVDYRSDARKQLLQMVRIAANKKDGLITIQVDNKSPQRAADMANAFVVELRALTNKLAITEAQQRRVFFEEKLKDSRRLLTDAQLALQSAGFGSAALRAEPRATAEGYAKLRAELVAAEVQLNAMRGFLAPGASELAQQQTIVASLRAELAKQEQQQPAKGDNDYVTRYREFKYQEALFEVYAKQFELARVDESREGALIQVVDAATPPDKKSKPKRLFFAVGGGMLMLGLMAVAILRRRASPA